MAEANTPLPSAVASTAFWTAFCRAQEALADDPLIVDALAEALCGPEGLAIGRAYEASARAHEAVVIRTRVIDERIATAVTLDGHRTVLMLGCGLDARAYRLSLPSDVQFVEVDLPATMAWKESRLRGVPRPALEVERRALDLADDDAMKRLLEGVARDRPLLVVLEGVLQYLPVTLVRRLFSSLAARSTKTSVICDVGGGAWARVFSRTIPRAAASRGARFVTRVSDARAFFEPLGFSVTSNVSLVEWDAARSAPRFERPWTRALLPGYRDVVRVVDLKAI